MAEEKPPAASPSEEAQPQKAPVAEAPTTPVEKVPPQEEEKKPFIVFKAALSQDGAYKLAEGNKVKPFGGGFFSKVKTEDIEVSNVALYYVPYVLQKAEYKVDYYRKNYYTMAVDNIVSEVIILGSTFTPGKGRTAQAPRGPISLGPSAPSPESTIKLEADERIIKEVTATIVIDRFGKEVPPSVIPNTTQEDNPEEVISNAGDKVIQPTGLREYATNLLKLKIAQRPAEAIRINSEAFNITETTTNYVPVYNILLRNRKTGDAKTLFIDAITSKVVEA